MAEDIIEGEFTEVPTASNYTGSINTVATEVMVIPAHPEVGSRAREELQYLAGIRKKEGWRTRTSETVEVDGVQTESNDGVVRSSALTVHPFHRSSLTRVDMKAIDPSNPDSKLGSVDINVAPYGATKMESKGVVATVKIQTIAWKGGTPTANVTAYLLNDGTWAEDNSLNDSGPYAGQLRPMARREDIDELELYVTGQRFDHTYFPNVESIVDSAQDTLQKAKDGHVDLGSSFGSRVASMQLAADHGNFVTHDRVIEIDPRGRDALGFVSSLASIVNQERIESPQDKIKILPEYREEIENALTSIHEA